jgi:DNA (cytosine-5)-methyltransferase 1
VESLAIPRPLRIGSLCTGYGGLDMAVHSVLGGALVWVADNDPGAARILAHHHPGVPNLGDITAVDWQQVPPIDIVLGGYPCQPFSSAGKRKGTEDVRHIWPHIARALRVLRPRYAIFENVAHHLRLGFDTVLSDLAALGFDAEWCLVRASEVGAPHQRKRLFVLAWPADTSRAGLEVRQVEHHAAELPAAERGRGEPAADADGRGREGHSQRDRRAVEGEPEDHSGLDSHGPGVRRETAADPQGIGRDQRRPEPARLQRRPGTPGGGTSPWGIYQPAIHRWQDILGRPAPRPTDPVGRLNPVFVEWLMGLPEGHVTDVPDLSRTAQLTALGNGVVPRQAEAALRILTARTQPHTTNTQATQAA